MLQSPRSYFLRDDPTPDAGPSHAPARLSTRRCFSCRASRCGEVQITLFPLHPRLHPFTVHRRRFQPRGHVREGGAQADMNGDVVPGGGVVRLPARDVRAGDD